SLEVPAALRVARDCREHRHAYRHAVGDLTLDDRLRAVGHVAGDLDIAIHRPRMHHDRAGGRLLHALRRDAEGAVIGSVIGDVRAAHALALDAQRHDHIDAVDAAVDIVEAL